MNEVILNWSTATETNNYGFEVERRIIGETADRWNTIGFVASAGTSNSPHEYSYSDNNLSPGRYAYRIKEIDLDGSFKYYGHAEVEIEITAPAEFALGQNYPNPFKPATRISFTLPSKLFASLKVFDALGREVSILVSEELPAGTYSQQWNAKGLPSGVYFYQLQAGLFTETKKLILLK